MSRMTMAERDHWSHLAHQRQNRIAQIALYHHLVDVPMSQLLAVTGSRFVTENGVARFNSHISHHIHKWVRHAMLSPEHRDPDQFTWTICIDPDMRHYAIDKFPPLLHALSEGIADLQLYWSGERDQPLTISLEQTYHKTKEI